MKPRQIRRLSDQIADYIFWSGNNEKATRLVLMEESDLSKPRNLGGWCERAVADKIEELIANFVKIDRRNKRKKGKTHARRQPCLLER